MKRIVIGFSIILFALILSWFVRDLIIGTFIIPVFMGILQLGRIINSAPQTVWWILLVLFCFSLFFTGVTLPYIGLSERDKKYSPGGRLDNLENLIKASAGQGSYSGRQLSLLLVNLHLKNQGKNAINAHNLENLLRKNKLPAEIEDFVRIHFEEKRKDSNKKTVRLSLEEAIIYLNRTIKGDPDYDRGSE